MALISIAFVVLLQCVQQSLAQQAPQTPIDPNFFPSLTATEKLTWVPCYQNFSCARLSVPADVDKKHGKEKVQIAIAKLSAISGNKKGTLMIQAGGFSGSNTNLVIQQGLALAPIFPDYDVIGVDRRGTGYSTPSIRCFGSEEERRAWAASEPPAIGTSEEALKQHLERAKQFGKGCKKYSGDALKWSGTYPSAVDVHTVMEAIGEKKVSWYGISSGTHNAHTFALLYPEAVDKFVLDGAARTDAAYTETISAPEDLADAELALDAFFVTCAAVGSTFCPFAGNMTAGRLEQRYNAIDDCLRKTSVGGFGYSQLHRFLAAALQDGSTWFPVLSALLLELEAKQPGPAVEGVLGFLAMPPGPLPPLDPAPPFDLLQAGLCIDARDIELDNYRDVKRFVEKMLKTSPAIGGIVAQSRVYCTGWQVKPKNVFPLSLLTPRRGNQIDGRILYIGNTADPLSPLDDAYHMHNRYFPKKSVVVIDHAVGHTAVAPLSAQSGITPNNFGIYPVIGTFLGADILAPDDSVYLPDVPPFLSQGAPYTGLPSGFGGVVAPAYPLGLPAWVTG